VEIVAHGAVLRWPDVGEDILVEGLLATGEIVVWPDVEMRLFPGTTAAAPRTRPVP
jgi:hypothetical protein